MCMYKLVISDVIVLAQWSPPPIIFFRVFQTVESISVEELPDLWI